MSGTIFFVCIDNKFVWPIKKYPKIYIITTEINVDTLIISTIPDQYGGPVTVTVIADDQQGLQASVQFDVTVNPENDELTIVSVPNSTAWEDIEYVYQIQVEDVDNDVFYYNLALHPDGMVIDSSGLVTWTPIEGILSSGIIILYVWDKENPDQSTDIPDIQTFSIDVIPVNDPPVIISAPVTTATEDELYNYQVLASDPDDIEFDYGLMNEPNGMTIDSFGLITWAPEDGVFSSGVVTVLVIDGGENDVDPTEQDLFIVVIPVNDPPAIISNPLIIELMVSDTFYYQIIVEDIDDDEFSYVLVDAPEGMIIDDTGFLTWRPQFPGEYGPITIIVSDGGEDGIDPVSQDIFILVTPFTDMITMTWEFDHRSNLISYLGIPGDGSIQTVLGPLGNSAQSIIGEGSAAALSDGLWIGSLQKISPTNGYWLILNVEEPVNPPIPYSVEALPTDPYIIYNLHEGQNLISYVGDDNTGISEALPDDIEEHIQGISTSGVATMQLDDGSWVGSLQNWNVLKGYWVNVDVDGDLSTPDTLTFSFE